jgi:transcriptional regulator with XRE-family HTH domain
MGCTTQADLVRATGISRSGISLLLNGQVRPSTQTIWLFAKIFKVTPEFIMRKTKDLPPKPFEEETDNRSFVYRFSLLPMSVKEFVMDFIDFLLDKKDKVIGSNRDDMKEDKYIDCP